MKNMQIQDERVLAQKRKIGNDVCVILIFALTLSVLVQQFMFNAPFSQYAVEMILLITIFIYMLIRNIMVGNDLFASNKKGDKFVVINSLISGTIITIVVTTLNYIRFGELFKDNIIKTLALALMTFLCASVTGFVILKILYSANKKKQMKIESELKDEDE